jgi:endoglucanase
MTNTRSLLETLSSLAGPSGFEAEVVRTAVELLKPLTDEAYVDVFGNAVGILRCGKPDAKRILFSAHLDEIGFIVTGAEEGFLRFAPIGSIDPRMLPGRELTIMTDPPTFGIITCLPPHVLSAEEMDRSFPMEDLRIDPGLSKEDVLKTIPVGTPAVYRAGFFSMGKDAVCGKAMDDRACFVAALLALEKLKGKAQEQDIVVLGSTREEIDHGGATVGTFSLDPDLCVAIDVTHAETPDGGPKHTDCVLGAGPAVAFGPNHTPWVRDRLFSLARQKEIPTQRIVMEGKSYTDGWEMQISREGIPTCVVSLPTRYMHTPMETISVQDIESLADLLAALMEAPGWEGDCR